MAEDLVTLVAYKEYRGVTNPDKDGKRLLLISFVSQLIKSYCGRTFIDYVDTNKVEQFDARQSCVNLAEWPLISVVSVKTSANGGIDQTLLTENDGDALGYFVDADNAKILTQIEDEPFLYEVDHPYKSLEVTYTAGFTVDDLGLEPEIPSDLKLAVFDTVMYYEDNEKSTSKVMASVSLDNPMPVISSDFPAHIKRILDLYRIIEA